MTCVGTVRASDLRGMPVGQSKSPGKVRPVEAAEEEAEETTASRKVAMCAEEASSVLPSAVALMIAPPSPPEPCAAPTSSAARMLSRSAFTPSQSPSTRATSSRM